MRNTLFVAWLVAVVSVPLFVVGCEKQTPADHGAEDSGGGGVVASVNRYELHGIITALPAQGANKPKVSISHEAIPGFVSMGGEAVGMKAMTMPFPLGEGVSVDGLAVGDPVRFTFEVTWDDAGSGFEVLSIEPAPDYVPATGEGKDEGAGHEMHGAMEHGAAEHDASADHDAATGHGQHDGHGEHAGH